MAESSQSSRHQKKVTQLKLYNLAEIIDKLAGGKDNLRLDVQEVSFSIGKTRCEVNGVVNFNVKHRNNRHWRIKQ